MKYKGEREKWLVERSIEHRKSVFIVGGDCMFEFVRIHNNAINFTSFTKFINSCARSIIYDPNDIEKCTKPFRKAFGQFCAGNGIHTCEQSHV